MKRVRTITIVAAVCVAVSNPSAFAVKKYNDCLAARDANMPAWVKDIRKNRKDILISLGQIRVHERFDANPPLDRAERCGCRIAQVDWEAVRQELPDWFFTDDNRAPRVIKARKELGDKAWKLRMQFQRKHCSR